MSFTRLTEAISKQTDQAKLIKLRDTGLDMLIALNDITADEKVLAVTLIENRLLELA